MSNVRQTAGFDSGDLKNSKTALWIHFDSRRYHIIWNLEVGRKQVRDWFRQRQIFSKTFDSGLMLKLQRVSSYRTIIACRLERSKRFYTDGFGFGNSSGKSYRAERDSFKLDLAFKWQIHNRSFFPFKSSSGFEARSSWSSTPAFQ